MAFIFPASIVCGDTVQWDSVDDKNVWSSTDYALHWIFAGSVTFSIITVANSDGSWTATLDGAVTENIVSGAYNIWACLLDVSLNRFTVQEGLIELTPNPLNVVIPFDGRSTAAKILAKIDEYLMGDKASVRQYKIEGRELEQHSIAELIKLRDRFLVEVEREKNAAAIAAGLGNKKNILVRYYH